MSQRRKDDQANNSPRAERVLPSEPDPEPVKGLGGLRKADRGGMSEMDTGSPPGPRSEEGTEPPEAPASIGKRRWGSSEGDAARPRGDRVTQRPQTAAPNEGGLKLPRGGLVAMRMSGGLRFTTQEVVVYRNGRVKVDPGPTFAPTSPVPDRMLDDEDLAELHRALDAANFPDLPPTSGRQNPDAYAYELVARPGRKPYSVEVFDGSIPEQVAPLIELLRSYMRPRATPGG